MRLWERHGGLGLRRGTMRMLLACLLCVGACGDGAQTYVQATGRSDERPSRRGTSATAPDAGGAQAASRACEIGAVSCEGALLRRCDDVGSAWDGIELCDAASLCDAAAGRCLDPPETRDAGGE
jgi:hypothetical protein